MSAAVLLKYIAEKLISPGDRYLRHHNPDPTAPNGVRPSAVQTFVKSTAGYCVITYLVFQKET